MDFPHRDDPRWSPIRGASKRLVKEAARPHWIREDGKALLALRCVEDAAEALRAESSPLLEDAHSDGRAEAVREILKECISQERTSTHGRLLWAVLDPEDEAVGTSATERRTIAGKVFRGSTGKTVGPSQIRQRYEPDALDWLTEALLTYEDAHIAGHED